MAHGLWVPRHFVKSPVGAMLNEQHSLFRSGDLFAFWVFNEHGGKAYDLVGQRSATVSNLAMWRNNGIYRDGGDAAGTVALDSGATDQSFWITTQMTIAYHGTLAAIPSTGSSILCQKNNNWILWVAAADFLPGGWPAGTLTLVWFDTGFVQRIKSVVPSLGQRHSAGFSMGDNGATFQGYYDGQPVYTERDGWFSAGRNFDSPVILLETWQGQLDCLAFSSGYWGPNEWVMWHNDPYSLLQTR